MNEIDEAILNELNTDDWHGLDYSQFSISNRYAPAIIKNHLRNLEKQGLIAKAQLWNYKVATYYKL